ncbi:hypothetical protein [Polaribacter aquimarinus]|uniref:Lipocalin-like domain-containing protein n=1 Tax=Polaribacter aquimarinus TaxID=2100726 RepID=A0A2U2JCG6_9FLAO|nr:hypothetical protein [Polaribacter aquimarinus]PWG06027.1 hypothetical protein DIS07_06230 [Polaribacter aquimarinus]
MKAFKYIITFFVATITLIACSDNNDNIVALDLSATNVSGTYKISSLNADVTNTTVTQGATVIISTAKITSDTFEVDFVLNKNGKFTVKGQYRKINTVTAANGDVTVIPKIINIDNSGSYTINTINRTISFNAINDNLLKGIFDVNFFNEDTLTVTQDSEAIDGSISTATTTKIIFVRK